MFYSVQEVIMLPYFFNCCGLQFFFFLMLLTWDWYLLLFWEEIFFMCFRSSCLALKDPHLCSWPVGGNTAIATRCRAAETYIMHLNTALHIQHIFKTYIQSRIAIHEKQFLYFQFFTFCTLKPLTSVYLAGLRCDRASQIMHTCKVEGKGDFF